MRRTRIGLALIAGTSLWAWAPVRAETAVAGEYQVKAAFLLHFARYVEWPQEAFPALGQPFVVTVLGPDPFGQTLEAALEGRTIRERPLAVRRASRMEEVGRTQILFIGSHEDLPRILRRLDAAPTLTIGEASDFAEQGGMVRFRTDRDRVGFEINVASADRAGLKISSQLLKLARIVGGGRKG